MYTFHTHFCTFGTNLHAQSVLSNKISASELRRKFIKVALLVGCSLFPLGFVKDARSLLPLSLLLGPRVFLAYVHTCIQQQGRKCNASKTKEGGLYWCCERKEEGGGEGGGISMCSKKFLFFFCSKHVREVEGEGKLIIGHEFCV